VSLPDINDRQAWLEWRNGGVTSSEVAAIMGCCPYKKAFDVFQRKVGRKSLEEPGNFVTDKGNEMEPIARRIFAHRYSILFGVDETFEPKLYEMEGHPFMRSSLDGQSLDGTINIEIKYMGKEGFRNAIDKIPHHHMLQMQHQMMVSGAERTYYVVINEDETVIHHVVEPDQDLRETIMSACEYFWRIVERGRWPWESEESSIRSRFEAYDQLTEQIKRLEAERDDVKRSIFESDVEICGNWRVNTVTRKGNINYAKIPALRGMDLEPYRQKPSVFKTITKKST
jgi:putative phage-type endonuclease